MTTPPSATSYRQQPLLQLPTLAPPDVVRSPSPPTRTTQHDGDEKYSSASSIKSATTANSFAGCGGLSMDRGQSSGTSGNPYVSLPCRSDADRKLLTSSDVVVVVDPDGALPAARPPPPPVWSPYRSTWSLLSSDLGDYDDRDSLKSSVYSLPGDLQPSRSSMNYCGSLLPLHPRRDGRGDRTTAPAAVSSSTELSTPAAADVGSDPFYCCRLPCPPGRVPPSVHPRLRFRSSSVDRYRRQRPLLSSESAAVEAVRRALNDHSGDGGDGGGHAAVDRTPEVVCTVSSPPIVLAVSDSRHLVIFTVDAVIDSLSRDFRRPADVLPMNSTPRR